MNNPTVYLENYYLAEEVQPISEGLADAVKKFSIGKIKSKFEDLKVAAKRKDTNKLEKVMKVAPKAPIGEVDKVANKMLSGYDKRKKMAEKEIKKTKVPKKIQAHMASLAAITTKTPDQTQKAVEYIGTRIDWKTVGAELGRDIIFDIILLVAAFVAFGYISTSLLIFLLIFDLIFLIYNLATKRVDVFTEV